MEVITRVSYIADGNTKIFSIPFDYLSRSHVHVKVNDIESPVEWLSMYSIQTEQLPAINSLVEIYRETPYDTQFITWADGTVLLANDLNAQTLQTLFVLQENQLALLQSLLFNTYLGSYDAKNKRITNVLSAGSAQDAANLSDVQNYVQSKMPEFQSILQSYLTQCATTAFQSAQSAGNAENSAQHTAALTAEALQHAALSCSCASGSQSWYQQFYNTVLPFLGIFIPISIEDGGSVIEMVGIDEIYDGGMSDTLNDIQVIYDGLYCAPWDWLTLNPTLQQQVDIKEIKEATLNSSGELVLKRLDGYTFTPIRIAVINKGIYNETLPYSLFDGVVYDGGYYICQSAEGSPIGILPTDTTIWTCSVPKPLTEDIFDGGFAAAFIQ